GGDVDEAVDRANAYLAAGADCTYPILCPPVSIPELARRIDGPMNVIVDKGVPEPADLQELGVARLTWGGGLAAVAYDAAVRAVEAVLPR
ncbi:MAG TPA: isocitrate lyase/phosphoenolpyruvate mutase family protein, partial [Gaiellaceae bacterium]